MDVSSWFKLPWEAQCQNFEEDHRFLKWTVWSALLSGASSCLNTLNTIQENLQVYVSEDFQKLQIDSIETMKKHPEYEYHRKMCSKLKRLCFSVSHRNQTIISILQDLFQRIEYSQWVLNIFCYSQVPTKLYMPFQLKATTIVDSWADSHYKTKLFEHKVDRFYFRTFKFQFPTNIMAPFWQLSISWGSNFENILQYITFQCVSL